VPLFLFLFPSRCCCWSCIASQPMMTCVSYRVPPCAFSNVQNIDWGPPKARLAKKKKKDFLPCRWYIFAVNVVQMASQIRPSSDSQKRVSSRPSFPLGTISPRLACLVCELWSSHSPQTTLKMLKVRFRMSHQKYHATIVLPPRSLSAWRAATVTGS
jgi:hypothetical protein